MGIELHLFIRFFLKMVLAALGLGGIVYMHMNEITFLTTGELIVDAVIVFASTSVLAILFSQFVPAKCPKCSENSLFRKSLTGRLRYGCKACGASVSTNVIEGASDNYDMHVDRTQMAEVKERRRQEGRK